MTSLLKGIFFRPQNFQWSCCWHSAWCHEIHKPLRPSRHQHTSVVLRLAKRTKSIKDTNFMNH